MQTPRLPDGFEAVSVLGHGSMGRVYKAWQPKLKRHVAIKTCNIRESESRGQDPRRVEDEALTIASLNHPNIVSLIDVVRDDESIFLIMELLEGAPLSELLNPEVGAEALGPLASMVDWEASEILGGNHRVLNFDALVKVGIAVAEALGYAHGRGIYHRDVKPANVVVTHDNQIKLLDFSIARNTAHTGSRTATGTIFGTVDYISPEQILARDIDGRTDIYSLGCTLFHAATGTLPFQTESDFATCSAHVSEMPPDPRIVNPRVSDSLGALVLKCMEKKRESRYDSTSHLIEHLRAIALGENPFARESTETFPIFHSDDAEDADPRLGGSQDQAAEPTPAPVEPIEQSIKPPFSPVQPPQEPVEETNRLAGSPAPVGLGEILRRAEERKSQSATSVPIGGAPGVRPVGGTVVLDDEESSERTKRLEDLVSSYRFLGIVAGAAGLFLLVFFVGIWMWLRNTAPDAPAPLSGDGSHLAASAGATGDHGDSPPVATEEPGLAVVRPPLGQAADSPRPAPTPRVRDTSPTQAAPLPRDLPVPEFTERRFTLSLGGGAEMVFVEMPVGAAWMGSHPSEPGSQPHEGPLTEIHVPMPFFIGAAEVTANQWRAVMGSDPPEGQGDQPAGQVGWNQAAEFCRVLSERTGLRVMLPTEAQWEYAARAGVPLSTSVSDGAATGIHGDPNAWGVSGMMGSAWEWTRDDWTDRHPGGRVNVFDTRAGSARKVLRGGGTNSEAGQARPASRRGESPDSGLDSVGFRIVIEL